MLLEQIRDEFNTRLAIKNIKLTLLNSLNSGTKGRVKGPVHKNDKKSIFSFSQAFTHSSTMDVNETVLLMLTGIVSLLLCMICKMRCGEFL